jgi:hypothetical protein
MKPGTPCFFRGAGCCSIYERRPLHPCREFVCGWLAPQSPFPEEFRPDRLGVMVVVKRWRGRELYVLRSAPRDPDEALLAWMREFSQRAGCPFIYEHEGERLGFGPPEFLREMAAIVERDGRLW